MELQKDAETGRPRGFGFVTMSLDEEEERAISGSGRALRVNKAKPRETQAQPTRRI
ncbi:hypothetical protein [Streptomyces hydrogenans]|uniref:hypothetical protein n=1 Tax=Streptomyces hydrogenans TaxID=1873719 RepID=UPI0038033654